MTAPTGTVAFLFTDIEGSTALWERAPSVVPGLLARHDTILRGSIARHGGHVFATGGDGFAVAYPTVAAAVSSATEAQRRLRAEPWPDDLALRVRMAVHVGEADEREGDYFGLAVNRTARLMATANGGQVVLSERAVGLLPGPPDGTTVAPRGQHLLKDLRRPELVHELVVDGVDGPQLRSARVGSGNLPDLRTTFVGRQEELATLTDLASDHRLVTVVGPGGVGKTRLALEHAGAAAGRVAAGAWFVDLSDAADGDVKGAVLTTVGLPAIGDWGALRRWDAHLVLDNCEHVVDAAAEVVDELLTACPDVSVVATSREALAVDGEHLLPLRPMTSSDRSDETDAIRLFVDRARATDPSYDPSPAALEEIAGLCDALDGLPLAIELAASRVGTAAVTDLASELLGPSTTRRARRRAGRHRSLRSAIAWSVDLLDEQARRVFARLAVFEGGFDGPAAAAVACDEAIDPSVVPSIVADLADQSMLQVRRTGAGPRFSMLETVRSLALELLGEDAPVVRRRHLGWAIEWSRAHSIDAHVPGWVKSTTELANQRAALRFAIDAGEHRAAIDLFAAALPSLATAGLFGLLQPTLDELSSTSAAAEPEAARQLDACRMFVAEVVGDFATSHALAERLRAQDDDDWRWLLGSSLLVHHLAATSPPDAARVLGDVRDRYGTVPMVSYLDAEIALAEARFPDAADAILASCGTADAGDLERQLRGAGVADPILLADLVLALHLSSRTAEAEVAAELLADTAGSDALAAYAPLVRAVVGSGRTEQDDVVADLRLAGSLERRWRPPLVVLDCLAGGALVAAELGRPVVAAEAVAVLRGRPQRSVSGFGVRRLLRTRLADELGHDAFAAAMEQGRDREPRDAFDRLVDALAP